MTVSRIFTRAAAHWAGISLVSGRLGQFFLHWFGVRNAGNVLRRVPVGLDTGKMIRGSGEATASTRNLPTKRQGIKSQDAGRLGRFFLQRGVQDTGQYTLRVVRGGGGTGKGRKGGPACGKKREKRAENAVFDFGVSREP
jgi:hypothetical protein